ncbi:class I SAM-dependent methyltransferase [Sulfitobacter sp. D35]|uniref:class I SAM-dependent methyltransferase n=1 Tax=Sulfitobacter sp. D35 TaxID=3083252 RepID=UPI00296EB3FC|nr:class I SAM-dependent methyltransferase [Sulfitobacter sp. D35]MDW4499263.1 class I SAM-dependent methyltransferase [Sulfitobacter sp. D35]
MTDAEIRRRSDYDRASVRWGDKMRTLGYYDGYLGFLSAPGFEAEPGRRIIDVGAGTGAFCEAWVAINGHPDRLTLLDPSAAMLGRAQDALRRRGVTAQGVAAHLGEFDGTGYDEALAAHMIEHCPDPLRALRQLRDLLAPGGVLRLVVSRPHWCNAIVWLRWRHRTFARDEIAELLGQAGFADLNFYRFPSGPPSRTSLGIRAVRAD